MTTPKPEPAPKPEQGSACPGCGHQTHGSVCMNFGSDNECPCKAGQQGSEETILPVTELEAEKSTSKILRNLLVKAEAERDEARATKDIHKERQEEAWAEVTALRAQLAEKEQMVAWKQGLLDEVSKNFDIERAAREKAEQERDKFEAESEQKGADLMAAEGVIAEIIDAHERSASSEIGQLIEDARAARAKESQGQPPTKKEKR